MVTEVLNRLRLGESSFTLEGRARSKYVYMFMTADMGKGKIVYVASSYGGKVEDFLSSSDLYKPKAFGVFVDNILYIFDIFAVDIPYDKGYDALKEIEGVEPLPSDEFNKKAVDLSVEFIENLVIPADFKYDVATLEKMVTDARLGNCDNSYKEFSYAFSVAEIVSILCNIDGKTEDTLKEDVIKSLEAKKDYYITHKAYSQKVKKILSEEILSPEETDEVNLANAMRTSTAKFVNVTFEVDGIEATGKVEPATILKILLDRRDCFSYWNFSTSVSGEKILKEYTARFGTDFKLKCKHIKIITYGKNVIYSRTA